MTKSQVCHVAGTTDGYSTVLLLHVHVALVMDCPTSCYAMVSVSPSSKVEVA